MFFYSQTAPVVNQALLACSCCNWFQVTCGPVDLEAMTLPETPRLIILGFYQLLPYVYYSLAVC